MQSCPTFARNWQELLVLAGIPRRYHDADQLLYSPPAGLEKLYQKVWEFLEDLPVQVAQGRGLLLKGNVGTSKTTVAVGVALQFLKLSCEPELLDLWAKPRSAPVLFVTMATLVENILSLKPSNPAEWARYEQRLRRVPLLILDDLGAEQPDDWIHAKLDALMAERYNNLRSTLITTNLSTDKLRDKYAERIIDQLRSCLQQLDFGGKSLRTPPLPVS